MGRALSFYAGHFAAWLVLAATAFVAGRLVLRRLDFPSGAERVAMAFAVGLGALGQALLFLGIFGWLTAAAVVALVVAVQVAGSGGWREAVGAVRRRWSGWRREMGCGRRAAVLTALALVAAAPFFVAALYPPTAFDETLYHLPFARAFAREAALPFLPELRFPVFPVLGEVLFTGMLLTAGDVATHLVELLAVAAGAALLFAWGRRVVSPAAGALAAAVFLGSPIAAYLGGTAYVEPALALFGCAAVYAVERWRAEGRWGWLAAAGFLAGAAASTKYLGLFFVGAIGIDVALAGSARRQGWRAAARPLLLFALVALASLAPTYGRILAHTGNPLFPFYPEVFGPSAWAADEFLGERGAARLGAAATLLWDVVFDRTAAGGLPPYSPALPLALPLLVWAAVAVPPVRRPLLYAAGYLAVAPAHAHYLFAVLPLLALAIGAALGALLARLRSPAARRLLPALLGAVLFLPGWLYALYRVAGEGPPPVTAAARERYLMRELPLYPAIARLNALGGRDAAAYGVFAERMVYFAQGRLLGDWNGPASFARVLPAARDAEELRRTLRRLGVSYLLVPAGREFGLPSTPEFRRRFAPLYADPHARLYRVAEDGGG